MTIKEFFGPVFDADMAVGSLVEDPRNKAGYGPGLRFYGWATVVLVIGAFLFGMGAGAFLRGRGLERMGMPMAWVHLSPWAAVLVALEFSAIGLLANLVFAGLADALMRRSGAAPGKGALFFNASLFAALPWLLFSIIPVLGWIVAAAGSVVSVFRVSRRVYAEVKDGTRAFNVWIAFAAAGALNWGLSKAVGAVTMRMVTGWR